jgi:hypothetical protein
MGPEDEKKQETKQETKKPERDYDVKDGVNLTSVSVVNKDGKTAIVTVKFENTDSDKHTSDNKVQPSLKTAFEGAVKDAAKKTDLTEITISSTTNGNHGSEKSLHYEGKALDISKVNSKPVVSIGDADPVKSIQTAFQSQTGRRENMGPSLMRCAGTADVKSQKTIDDHKNHVHLGVE